MLISGGNMSEGVSCWNKSISFPYSCSSQDIIFFPWSLDVRLSVDEVDDESWGYKDAALEPVS